MPSAWDFWWTCLFRLSPAIADACPSRSTPLPRLLRDAGYSTMAVGRRHLTLRGQRSHAGPFDTWPLGFGFESFYGFLQGDTNQWTPNLVRDNHYVDPPSSPEEGYHRTEDLADVACRRILDRRQSSPDKPFFLYFAPGAMHAPHHVPPGWAERYAGTFDDGWESGAKRTFARQQGCRPGARGRHLDTATRMGAGVGRARRRLAPPLRTPAGDLRGFSHPHRRTDRPDPRCAPAVGRPGRHDRDGPVGQRGQRRRRAGRHLQRAPFHSADDRQRRCEATLIGSRTGAASGIIRTTRGVGPGLEIPPSGCGRGMPGSVELSALRSSFTGPAGISPAAARSGPSSATR